MDVIELQSDLSLQLDQVESVVDLQSVSLSRQDTILKLAEHSPDEAIAFARSTRSSIEDRFQAVGLHSIALDSLEYDFSNDSKDEMYSVERFTVCSGGLLDEGMGHDHTHHSSEEVFVLRNSAGEFIQANLLSPSARETLTQTAYGIDKNAKISQLDGILVDNVAILSTAVSTLSTSLSTSSSSYSISSSIVCDLPAPEADSNGVSPVRSPQRLRLRGRRIIVYVVKFSDLAYPVLSDGSTIDEAYINAQFDLVDQFWRNMTNDKLYVSQVDVVFVPFTTSSSTYTSTCDRTDLSRVQMMEDLIEFVNNDDTLSNSGDYDGSNAKYSHRVVVIPKVYYDGCGETWGGIASTPGNNVFAQSGYNFRIFGHELGHNFGLGHANVIIGDLGVDEWIEAATGQSVSSAFEEYADNLDTMSGTNSNETYSFSASHLHYIRVLDSEYIANAATLGYASNNTVIYNLAAIDDTRTLEYLDNHSPDWYYTYAALHVPLSSSCDGAGLWLEYRGSIHNTDHYTSDYMYGHYASNTALHGYIRFDPSIRRLNYYVSALELNQNLRDSGLDEQSSIFETTIQPGDTWVCPDNICSGELRVTVLGASSPDSGSIPGMMSVRVHSGPGEASDETDEEASPIDSSATMNVIGWVPAYPTVEKNLSTDTLAISGTNPAATYFFLTPPSDSNVDGDSWQSLEVAPKYQASIGSYTTYYGPTSPETTFWWRNVTDTSIMRKAIRSAAGNLSIIENSISSGLTLGFSLVNRNTTAHQLYTYSVPSTSNLSVSASVNNLSIDLLSLDNHGLAQMDVNFSSSISYNVQDEVMKLGSSSSSFTVSGAAGGYRAISAVNSVTTGYQSSTYFVRMDWVHPAYTIQQDYTSTDLVLVTPLFPPKGLSLYRTLPMNAASPSSYAFSSYTTTTATSALEATLEFTAASPAQNGWHKSCVFAPYVPSGNTMMDIDWALHAVDTDSLPTAAVLSLARWPTDNEFDPNGSLSFELFRAGSRSIYTTDARISILNTTPMSVIEANSGRYFSTRLNVFDWVTKDSAQSWNYICVSVYEGGGEHMTITSPRIYELKEVVDSLTTANNDVGGSTSTAPTVNQLSLSVTSSYVISPDSNLKATLCGETKVYPDDDDAEDTFFCGLGLSESVKCPYTISVSPSVAASSSVTTYWNAQSFGTRTATAVSTIATASGAEESPATSSASSGLSSADLGTASSISTPIISSIEQSAMLILGGSVVGYIVVLVLLFWFLRQLLIMVFGCIFRDDVSDPVVVSVKKGKKNKQNRR